MTIRRLLCCFGGARGETVFDALLERFPRLPLALSVSKHDPSAAALRDRAAKADVPVLVWRDVIAGPDALDAHQVDAMAMVGWRYLVPPWLLDALPRRVLVAHDSLLPKYRGFAPLATALIQGDPEVGVTVFLAEPEVDTGDVIAQHRTRVGAHHAIGDLMTRVIPLYVEGVCEGVRGLVAGNLVATPQDDSQATYSLWRDEEDYFLDWTESAERLERTVRALGPPLGGARARVAGQVVQIEAVTVEPDLPFEVRQVGKVWRIAEGGEPVVVCGTGLLRITRLTGPEGSLLPWKTLRVRFS
ncbi:MAG: formyltransferase family protein [Myxococcota bacterium]